MRLILQQKKSERCQSCVFCVNFRNIVHAVIKRNISKKKKERKKDKKKLNEMAKHNNSSQSLWPSLE